MAFMTALMQQAEEILDTAVRATDSGPNLVILINRQGGMRMLDAAGWTLAGLSAEYGASALFEVKWGPDGTSVEGWAGLERCRIERRASAAALCPDLTPAVRHPIRLQVTPLLIEASSDRVPAI